MKSGCLAYIQMEKQLKKGLEKDERRHQCEVHRYDAKEECVYLTLRNAVLTELSLDAVYRCVIQDGEEGLCCTGRIHERFHAEGHQMVKFEIENGFYKICVNSVDK